MPAALCALALITAPAALAAPPAPFGHPCTAQNGVLFCPTADDSQRVPSFDGTPMDVDVTLPPSGDGPFPTIVLMHGYGGDKTAFEKTTPEGSGGGDFHYNNIYFAQQGYAVVTPSVRGFGRSCGKADSRTAGCEKGWIHLNDQRVDARDTQHLLGLLADQGVTNPGAIGVSGISYGGGQTFNLAYLKNRIRNQDGSFAPWTSPGGKPMSIAAAWPRWGWTDLAYALSPNGTFLDFQVPPAKHSTSPVGVKKDSYVDIEYNAGKALGYVAPRGVDPTADLEGWKAILDKGEPYGADMAKVGDELVGFHSVSLLPEIPAPLLIENGWTDDLFPVSEALRPYNSLINQAGARVALQLGDLGHSRGQNKKNADHFFNEQGAAFMAELLKKSGTGPPNKSVTAFSQTCPVSAGAGGPFSAATWRALHPGAVGFGDAKPQSIGSNGGDPAVAKALNPIGGDKKGACATVSRAERRVTANYELKVPKRFTLLGLPTVKAKLAITGKNAQLVARLWDVEGKKQTLVSRGVFRPGTKKTQTVLFQLNGNAYSFKKGHRVKLQLLGRDAGYLRPSNGKFKIKVSNLRVELPTREKPDKRFIGKPVIARGDVK
jgi:pimeloyl-ACP methyl ester carboxylesterase